MESLFNKRFVYFMWDDELEGKEGFFADSIDELQNYVALNYEAYFGRVRKSSRGDYPFTLSEAGASYRFFYADPNYEVKKAYNEGKTIQFYDSSECEWSDVENPLWNPSDKCRVKPEEKKVPFENKEELIRKWEAMNPGCKSRPGCANPMIWVKDCAGSYLITGYKDYTVIVNGNDITFLQLYNKYTFLDGTVIGKRS